MQGNAHGTGQRRIAVATVCAVRKRLSIVEIFQAGLSDVRDLRAVRARRLDLWIANRAVVTSAEVLRSRVEAALRAGQRPNRAQQRRTVTVAPVAATSLLGAAHAERRQ